MTGNNENKSFKATFEDGSVRTLLFGTSLSEISEDFQRFHEHRIIAAKVNNDIRELSFKPTGDCKVDFIDVSNIDGGRIYARSLNFILIKAAYDIFPKMEIIIRHTLSKGLYIETKDGELKEEEVLQIEKRMRELVAEKLPFIKREVPFAEAKEMLFKCGRADRFHAIEYRVKSMVTIYSCGGYDDYFYGYMAPDTSYLNKFALVYYPPGMILMSPETKAPEKIPEFREQKKLFSIFSEYEKWGEILEIGNLGALNDIIEEKKSKELIMISEALQEKKVAMIADMITGNHHKKSIVLIAGPSSSGKTTFAQRLTIQLRVNGIKPINISLDDYFVDRNRTPLDEDGNFDYESIYAIDIELFNKQLADLIKGLEVEVPLYNFQKGGRDEVGRKLKLEKNQILIIEGIHGLNEKLTSKIAKEDKFKIYVSALTSMNIDDHNRIPTTDARIIRRIVRDFHYRNCDALSTIERWPSVRRGEELNIFPFQEEADTMFNSALPYELSVLKKFAEPLLKAVDNSHPEYSEAKRLIEFLSYFQPIDTSDIPKNSIIREFIGGSSFV